MRRIDRKYLFAALSLLLSAVAVFSGVQIWREHTSRQKDINAFAELAAIAEVKAPDPPRETASPELTDTEEIDAAEEPEISAPAFRHDIPLLIEQNGECIGWITIDDTAVDYPVMHTPEWPQKHLHMNFYGEYSDSGVPFLDYRCSRDSDNLIIYGHNMRNGTMFSALTDYLSDGYLEAHPTILLETVDGAYEFHVFAVASVNKLDKWYSFIDAESEDAYQEAISQLMQKAVISDGTLPVFGDHLLTLSTCYGGNKDSRLIVIARR